MKHEDITLDNLSEHQAHLKVELMNPQVVKTYLADAGNFAAVCYDTDTTVVSPDKIAKHCLSSGHMSAMRAVYFIFKVTGMARILTQQVCRHSVGVEFNQKSQRYCDESKPLIVIPDSILGNPKALEKFINCQNVVYRTYRELGEMGIPMDDSRLCLTNATASEFNIGFTPQALMHFCHERCCSRASWQTRILAWNLAQLVSGVEPYFTKFLVPKCQYIGYCTESKDQCCGRMPHKSEVLRGLGVGRLS